MRCPSGVRRAALMALGVGACLLAALAPGPAVAGDDVPKRFYYVSADAGSTLQLSPLSVLVNGGLDILRNPSVTDRIFAIDYATGFGNVADNLWRVDYHLRRIGVGRFAAHEILPIRGLETNYGQFVPNYFMHSLGEGMLYRMLSEYYQAHGVDHPRWLALGTVVAMQWLNEAAENGSFRGSNQDPIADMLLFNPIGFALFSFDAPARFFSGPMGIHYWPGQPVLMPAGPPGQWRLLNQGENFAFHMDLGLPAGMEGFMYYGKQGLFGVAMPLGADTVSAGLGPSLLGLLPYYEDHLRIMLPGKTLQWEAGLFWDRQGSLLASAIATVKGPPALHLNLYPRALPGRLKTDAGFFLKYSQIDGWMGGLSWTWTPVGLGWASAKPGEGTLLR
ncbi:MAG: hypothetical protein HY902_19350 [Deltaproteobacteria bacterium]|nr:hypothetical protein [Deltaproteobacteria bacterium]